MCTHCILCTTNTFVCFQKIRLITDHVRCINTIFLSFFSTLSRWNWTWIIPEGKKGNSASALIRHWYFKGRPLITYLICKKCKHIGDFPCALDTVTVARGASQPEQIMFSYVVPEGGIFKSACIALWDVHVHLLLLFQHDGCASYSKVIRVIIWWSTIHYIEVLINKVH